MEMEAKEFTYDVLLEDGGVMLADGAGAIDAAGSLEAGSLPRRGAADAARSRASATTPNAPASKRPGAAKGTPSSRSAQTDERYAVVEIVVSYDVALEPDPGDEGVSGARWSRPSATASSAPR